MIDRIADSRAAFRRLHDDGCFVLPNPWDVGGARMLQSLGFKALASTSAGLAWSIGQPDNAVTRDTVLAHLSALCAAVDLPINADFENGFAHEPAGVATNVRLAVGTGVAGLSIEDKSGEPGQPFYDDALAVERIRAARAAIDDTETGVVLVARTEAPVDSPAGLTWVIDRLAAFADAGADCLYAPQIRSREQIAAAVKALSPRPLNVLMTTSGLSFAELADLGVRRISVGGALARVAWGAFIAAAEEIAQAGRFDSLGRGASGKRLNDLFSDA